jgi:hypothetical protein
MRAYSTDIPLVFGGQARLSSTRATSDFKFECSYENPTAVWSSTRATGDRKAATWRRRRRERRSSTRATRGPLKGPPRSSQQIRIEGPAQPALRRFRVSRKTMPRPSLKLLPELDANRHFLKNRLAARRRCGLQRKKKEGS